MPTTTYVDTNLSILAVGDRTDSAGVDVDDLSAEEARLVNLLFTPGVVDANDWRVTERGAGANMSVDVGSGVAANDLAVVAGTSSGQGHYLVRLAAATVNVAISAADVSQARTDAIYLVVADAPYDGGSLTLPRIGYRKGDAGGGAPGPDAGWDAYLLLATVSVPANDTTISTGQITDARVRSQPVSSTVSPLGVVAGDLDPDATGTRDLGDASLRWRVGYINQIIGGAGSPSTPIYGTTQASNDGIYFPGAGNMQFSAGGVARFGITSTQIQAPLIHDATTGSAANVVVASTGSNQLLRSTSALRYKEQVTPAPDLADIELVPTRHFRPDDNRWRYGLIADWLADQDDLIGVFGEDERVEDYDDRAVLAVFAAKHLRTQTELEQVQAQLEKVQAQLEQLTNGRNPA